VKSFSCCLVILVLSRSLSLSLSHLCTFNMRRVQHGIIFTFQDSSWLQSFFEQLGANLLV
jgi:hypothetical protein